MLGSCANCTPVTEVEREQRLRWKGTFGKEEGPPGVRAPLQVGDCAGVCLSSVYRPRERSSLPRVPAATSPSTDGGNTEAKNGN